MRTQPIIGTAARRLTMKGEFINASINKEELMNIIPDEDGNIRLTLAQQNKEMDHSRPGVLMLYVVYEDEFIPARKRK